MDENNIWDGVTFTSEFVTALKVLISNMGSGGLISLVAGTDITLSPANGIGVVTINASSPTSASINGLSDGAQSNLASGSATQVQLQTNHFANGVTWGGAAYEFIIVTAGQYLLIGEVAFGTLAAVATVGIGIYVNGVQVAGDVRYSPSGATSPAACNISIIYNMSVGDTVQLWMSQTSGFTDSLSGAYLGIAKL